jgi:hypothetical protein
MLLGAVLSAASGGWVLERLSGEAPVVDPVPGTETWTVEEIEALRQGSAEIGIGLRRQVGIVAVAGPGRDGLLTAPDSGVECVWWRSEKIRHYTEWIEGERQDRTERVGHDWSRSAFTLTDETGTLLVRAADVEVIGASKVHSRRERFEPDKPAPGQESVTTGLVYTEYVLPAGTTIFVHGEAHDADEQFVTIGKPLDGGPFILSRQPEYLLRSKARKKLIAADKTRLKGYLLLILAPLLLVLAFMI